MQSSRLPFLVLCYSSGSVCTMGLDRYLHFEHVSTEIFFAVAIVYLPTENGCGWVAPQRPVPFPLDSTPIFATRNIPGECVAAGLSRFNEKEKNI